MTVIYMLRHGQTDYNIKGLWHGGKSGSLNEAGVKQAEKAAMTLLDAGIDIILSSDSDRAIETAAIVSEKISVPLAGRYPIFGDRGYGEAECLTSSEISRRYGITVANVLDPAIDKIPQAESVQSLRSRAIKARDLICSNFPGKTVLVTSHGGFVRMFYKTFAGDVSGKFFTNCSYYSVECLQEVCNLKNELFTQ
ncbi:MAG: histidine phosphatase family protein [Thermoplasmataceae archaeon]